MTRYIKASVTFYLDPNNEPIEEGMTDDELMEYAKQSFCTDIGNLWTDNDLIDFIDVEIVE